MKICKCSPTDQPVHPWWPKREMHDLIRLADGRWSWWDEDEIILHGPLGGRDLVYYTIFWPLHHHRLACPYLWIVGKTFVVIKLRHGDSRSISPIFFSSFTLLVKLPIIFVAFRHGPVSGVSISYAPTSCRSASCIINHHFLRKGVENTREGRCS